MNFENDAEEDVIVDSEENENELELEAEDGKLMMTELLAFALADADDVALRL